jgi:hypothetical protein
VIPRPFCGIITKHETLEAAIKAAIASSKARPP